MEYWKEFMLCFLVVCIPHSAIYTPQSRGGVILCYGSWMALEGENG